MTLILGLFLTLVSIFLIYKLKKFNITKKEKRKYYIAMFLETFLYLLLCFIVDAEPFNFEDAYRAGDYIIYSLVILLFTPFMWMNLIYIFSRFFKSLRINKKFKINSNKEYTYYRDDLNKISPSLVMFVSNLELDVRKSVSAVVLKLKLTGHIKEEKGKIIKTDKNKADLLKSEKLVLDAINFKDLDENKYIKLVEEETINNHFIRKNRGNKIIKLIKIALIIVTPILLIYGSMKFDTYVFNNYKTYVYDGKRYVSVMDNGKIGDIHYGKIDNINDYYHGEVGGRTFYDKALIRADKYDNSYVLKVEIYQILDILYITFSIVSVFAFIYLLVRQIIFFNKGYFRTSAGTDLLNKAHGLKNYLKDFSVIKTRKEKELILWEYYLIYAVILGVNETVDDSVVEKYFK